MNRIAPTWAAGLMLGVLALVFGAGAFRLGFWTDDGPGPGLLPLIAASLLLPMTLIAMREPVAADETPFKATPLIAVALTLAYALILPRAGFVLATFTLLTIWIRAFYRQDWLRALVCSASLTAAGLVVFAFLLKVPMRLWPVWP